MINFHKFGFLDIKKMMRYVEEKNYWHSFYCPNYVFIWSDYYKTEIAYDNDFCYIRFVMPNIGLTYYPPLLDPLSNVPIKDGIDKLRADAYESGYDFYMAPIDERTKERYKSDAYKFYPYENYQNYYYYCEDLAFYNTKALKAKKKLCVKYEIEHPFGYFRVATKEDFPAILEFISNWREKENPDYLKSMFYTELNVIKKAIDHMYELDIAIIIMYTGDSTLDKIVGVAIGTILNNVLYEHIEITYRDMLGAKEELLMCLARSCSPYVRYINKDCHRGDKAKQKELEGLNPNSIEEFNATFRM